MGSEWQRSKLGDVIAVNPSRPLAKGSDSVYISMQQVETENRSISEIDHRAFKGSGARFQNGDTLLARITPCLENGKTAYVDFLNDEEVGHGSTEFIVLSGIEGVSDDLFVYYLARYPEFRNYAIVRMEGSSGRQRVPAPTLKKYVFACPSYDEQRAIAHILGSLDDKIELNRRMNKTQEGMARAIFKSWFVDFDPVRAKAEGRDPGLPNEIAALFPESFEDSELGEIPTGWELGVIGDIASTALGGQWGKEKAEDGLVPVVCLRGCDMEDLRKEGYAPKAPVRFIKESAVEKRLPRENDLLIAASGAGPCGRPLWCSPLIKKAYSQTVLYSNFVKRFATSGPEYAVYLDRFFHEKFIDKSIQDFITGTSVPNLDSNGLLTSCRIVIPTKKILKAFYWQNQSIFKKLYAEENVVLSKIRGILLPKLISGELRVPDAEKLMEDVE